MVNETSVNDRRKPDSARAVEPVCKKMKTDNVGEAADFLVDLFNCSTPMLVDAVDKNVSGARKYLTVCCVCGRTNRSLTNLSYCAKHVLTIQSTSTSSESTFSLTESLRLDFEPRP